MMFLIILCGLLCAPITHSEAVFCQSDEQCPDGSYCENNGKPCVKCLNCEDFKRMPGSANKCKRTIAECGPCFDGLVAEQQYCNKQSTPPKEAEGIPAYTWAIIFGVLLVLVFLIVVVFIYLFRGNVLKISSRTLLRGSCPGGTNRELNIHASAPDLPPPYNPYTPVPPDSPPTHIPAEGMHGYHYTDTTGEDRDTAGPFVKRAPSSHWPYQSRESDDNQNAVAYNKPNYERRRSPILDDADHFSSIQDENTTESTWTPATNSNNINGNTSSNETSLEQASHTNGAGAVAVAGSNPAAGEPTSLSALVAAAKDTTLVEPPAKRTKQHDSNNNGNAGAVVTNANDSNTNNNTIPQQTPQAVFVNIQFNNYP